MTKIEVEAERALPELLASLGASAAAQHRVLAAAADRQELVRARLADVAARHPGIPTCTLVQTLNLLAAEPASDAAEAAALIEAQLRAAGELLREFAAGAVRLPLSPAALRAGMLEAVRDLRAAAELELGAVPADLRARFAALLGPAMPAATAN